MRGRLTETPEHDDEVRERALDEDEDIERDGAYEADERAQGRPVAVCDPSTQRIC